MNKTKISCVVIDLSLSSVDCVNYEKNRKYKYFVGQKNG